MQFYITYIEISTNQKTATNKSHQNNTLAPTRSHEALQMNHALKLVKY